MDGRWNVFSLLFLVLEDFSSQKSEGGGIDKSEREKSENEGMEKLGECNVTTAPNILMDWRWRITDTKLVQYPSSEEFYLIVVKVMNIGLNRILDDKQILHLE